MPDFSKVLTIMINEEPPERTATFIVDESVMTKRSKYFKAACRDEWKEATSRTIKIPEVDTDAFCAYLHWVHLEQVAISTQYDVEACSSDDAPLVLDELIRLWLLADRLGDAQLCDCVIDTMLDVADSVDISMDWTEAIPAEMLDLIYAATSEGRSLRRLVVDIYAGDLESAQVERGRYEWHPEFVNDIMLVYAQSDDVYYSDRRSCYYHEHLSLQTPLCMSPSGRGQ